MLTIDPAILEKVKRLPPDLQKQWEKIEQNRQILLQKEARYKETHLCEYFKVWKWQTKALDLVRKFNVVIVPAPNKVGKSALLCNLINSWALGYEPWTRSQFKKDGYIEINKCWYRPSSLGKNPPVKIRLTGEDWTSHIGQTIVPEFEKWAIRDSYDKRMNNHPPVPCFYTYKNGSTIELMTHGSELDKFESWIGDAWCPDEPPPQKVYEAMARGLFLRKGKIVMFVTPLKESWILNELIEPDNKRYDVGVLDGLTFLYNEELYNHDKTLLSKANCLEGDIDKYFELLLDYENKSKGEHVNRINDHIKRVIDDDYFVETITKLMGLRFVNEVNEENRDARFKGIFKHLIGRIYKSYKDFYHPSGHLLKPFKIDTDWPVICEIDWHHVKPPFIGFYAIDKHNRMYVIQELFVHMTGERVAHEIIRRKKANGWRLNKVFTDPLAKGNNKLANNTAPISEDSYTIMKRILNKEGILIETTGSEKANKWTGIDRVQEKLSPSGGIPELFVFDSCMMHRKAFSQWVYDDNGMPSDVDDHPMETLYRAVLSGVKYTDPKIYKIQSKPDKSVV